MIQNKYCLDCTERKVGCHASCKKYKEYRQALTEQTEKIRHIKNMNRMFYKVRRSKNG